MSRLSVRYVIVLFLLLLSIPAQAQRQRILMDSGWQFNQGDIAGVDAYAGGTAITTWKYLVDANGPRDASTYTPANFDDSSWATATPGQDVFNGQPGYAWFRVNLESLITSGQDVGPHNVVFESVDDNATVYLNGNLVKSHVGWNEQFQVSLDAYWVKGGPNELVVLDQNLTGPGGIGATSLILGSSALEAIGTTGYDDSSWTPVHLPHDYVIQGTFDQYVDGGHGYLPAEPAWYRKSFTVPASAAGSDIWIDFDGAYRNSVVSVNGHFLGVHASGYTSFRYDITPYVNFGGANEIAVHVDPTWFEGWWYEGGGIYRHVWLNIANPVHVAPWGTYVTSTVNGSSATDAISTTVANTSSAQQNCTVVSTVYGPDGGQVFSIQAPATIPADGSATVSQSAIVANPVLWSLTNPSLYRLNTQILLSGVPVDSVDTRFGIRTIAYTLSGGFFLNGQHVLIQGMCNHEDFIGVGSGMPDSVLYYRLQQLKAMGCNAYRTSHGPTDPEILDYCDQLGILVMDENRHFGNSYYAKSAVGDPYSDMTDLQSLILRDRNHPSVIMWSMCNEEWNTQATSYGETVMAAMKSAVYALDDTRPITCANNSGFGNPGFSPVLDIIGLNYSWWAYPLIQTSAYYPNTPDVSSEDSTSNSTRGVYADDSTDCWLSAYGLYPQNGQAAGVTAEEYSWQEVVDYPIIAGAFFWTGFDYLGEPTPYPWPAVSSQFGVLDRCGFFKDSAYEFQSMWSSTPMVHLLPHWNWTSGQTISVWAYSNCSQVELFLNGVSLGVQTVVPNSHLVWSVPWAAGTLTALGYNDTGQTVASDTVNTAGAPAAIELSPSRTTLACDGEDLSVVAVSIVDAQGNVVPTANNEVTFSLSGPGRIAGVGNGNPSSHEPEQASQRAAFNGLCAALVQSEDGQAGTVTLTASSPGLVPATLKFTVAGPTAISRSVAVPFNTATPVVLSALDTHTPAQNLTYSVTAGPANGTLTGSAPNLTYTPNAGYSGPDSFTFTAEDVSGLVSPPATVTLTVASGRPAAFSASLATIENAPAAITLAGADPNVPPLPLTFNVVSQPADGVLTGTAPNLIYTPNANYVGSDSFTFTVSNGANTSSAATVAVTVSPLFDPITTLSLSGPLGSNGWYTGPVVVTLSAAAGSYALAATYDSVDGAPKALYAAPFTVSGDGIHKVTFWSVDVNGNVETAHQQSIDIDGTPPTLAFSAATPAPNPAGWNKSPVAIGFTAADVTSGVAATSPQSPLTFAGEGAQQTQTVTVTDSAGNSAQFTSPAVSIDLTPPVTAISTVQQVGATTVTLAATDNLSGVAATWYALDSGSTQPYLNPIVISSAGSHTLSYGSVDVAGNVEPAHSLSVLVDGNPPATVSSLAGPAGLNGWYRGPVNITLTASSAMPIAATYFTVDSAPKKVYSAAFTVSGDGAHTITFWSVDSIGFTEKATTLMVDIDATSPTLKFGSVSGVSAASGWYTSPVTIPYTDSDATSGVASATPGSPLTFASGGKAQSRTVTVTDNAGNFATFAAPAVNIDLNPPVTTLTDSVSASSATVTLTATDDVSGVAATYYTTDGGPLETYAAPFGVSGIGSHSVTYYSVDVAGNVEPTHQANIVVSAPAITLAVSPASVPAGSAVTGTITLAYAAPAGGLSVDIGSSVASASAPPTVSIASGATKATFTITTAFVPTATAAVITAATGTTSATANLTITPQAGTTFGGGLSLISVPYAYPGISPDAVFGYSGVRMAVWNPTATEYSFTPTSPADAVRLGVGYWIKLPAGTLTLAQVGTPANPGESFAIALAKGWNMIGDPFLFSVNLESARFLVGNTTETFTQAVEFGALDGSVYAYSQAGNSYSTVSALSPGSGYWIYAYGAGTLMLPPPG